MLTVYDKATTSFLTNGLGSLREFKSNPLITEVLNGEYILEFKYAKEGWLNEHLVEENIIKANGQPFRIINIQKDLKEIRVLAKHIAFDLNNNFFEDVAPTDQDGIGAINWLLDRTQYAHNFTGWSDVDTVTSARYVRKNVFEALLSADNSLVNRWGGEFEYDNYTIKMYAQRGSNRGLQIRHGKNLSGVDVKLDFSTVATRIMPQGIDGLFIPEKYIDSPLIDNYLTPIIRKIDFDIGIDENTPEEQAQELLSDAVYKLYENRIDTPTVSMRVDFIELSKVEEYKQYSNLESVYLGDTVNIYIESLGIEAQARVVKVVYDCLKERNIKLELGTVTPNFVNSQRETIKKEVIQNNPSVLAQAKADASALIKQPFEGYEYRDGLGSWYLMDTPDINTAQNLWKFGLGGIGFSSTGINGDFEIAITQDGEIVADFITAGQMSVSRITGLEESLEGLQTSIDITKEGLLVTIGESGGANLFINPVGLQDKDVLTNAYGWAGECKAYTNTEIQNRTFGKSALFLQNGSREQIVQVPNGDYTVSFLYKKLIELAECSVVINGETISLTEADWTIFKHTFTVNANQIEIKLVSDTNDSAYVSDLMGNAGTVAQTYSSNATEVVTDNVKIGEGIEISSSASNIKQKIDNDGNRIINTNTDEVVSEFTDKGMKTKELEAEKAQIAGTLIQKQGNQTWFSVM